MVVEWEGGAPPDYAAWFDALREALGEDDASYWVRFHRGQEGWRFDLERRQAVASSESSFGRADESVALHVYATLVEWGLPLDPVWRPLTPSPPARVTRRPVRVVAPAVPPAAEAAPAVPGSPGGGAAPPPTVEGDRPAESASPPESIRERTAVSVEVVQPASVLEPEPPSEAQPASVLLPPARRGLRPAIVYLPALLLVAFVAWLSWNRLPPRAAPPPAPSPAATVSPEALAGQGRGTEAEAGVTQRAQERARVIPGRQRPATPAPVGARQRASGRPSPQPAERRADETLAPTPASGPTATPATATDAAPIDVPLPVDRAVSTDAGLTAPPPAAPAPTPSPVQGGALVDVNDPGLTRPTLVTQTRPRYPPQALARRLSGTVSLNALVDETGAVVATSIVQASPSEVGFEEAATRYVRARVYRPATKQGVPVRVWLPIVIEFRPPDR